MTNATYTDYPFTAQGVKFISRINANSPFAGKLAKMPTQAVTDMNIQAITELVGNASLLTHDELLTELEKINDGGTHAFILLDEAVNA
jgi:1,4-dihydroxy-2-naphthoyl-CoA synthase